MAGIIVAAVVIVLILFVISQYNKLVKGRINVEEAFATMDVYLKKRFDLIPNLVETVKGYAKHEKETLEQVIALRNQNYDAMSDDEKVANGAAISKMIPKILAVAESYPDLKANANFMELSSQLQSVENDIANSRKYYNGMVKRYNLAVQTIPSNIIAGLFHFETKKMFEVESVEERKNVKVEF